MQICTFDSANNDNHLRDPSTSDLQPCRQCTAMLSGGADWVGASVNVISSV